MAFWSYTAFWLSQTPPHGLWHDLGCWQDACCSGAPIMLTHVNCRTKLHPDLQLSCALYCWALTTGLV